MIMKTLHEKSIFLIFLFIAIANSLLAQLEYTDSKLYALSEGLSDAAVRSITQDEAGLLWLGTAYGINRFDGNNFLKFTDIPQNGFQISGAHLDQVVPLPNQQLALLYRGQNQFIDLFHSSSFTTTKINLDESQGLKGTFKAIFAQEQDAVYVLTLFENKLYIFKLHKNNHFKQLAVLQTPILLPTDEFRLSKTTAGNFLISSAQKGLFILDKSGALINSFNPSTITPGAADILYHDQQGRIWVSFYNVPGLWMQESANTPFKIYNTIPTIHYNGLWEDKFGNIFISAENKIQVSIKSHLYLLSKENKVIDASNLLEIENKLITIYGNDFTEWLFLGTHTGLYKVRLLNKKIERHIYKSVKPGEWGASMRGFTSDSDGNVYVAREVKTWYKLDAISRQLDTLELYDPVLKKVLNLTCSGELFFEAPHYLWGITCRRNSSGFLLHYNLNNGIVNKYPIPPSIQAFSRDIEGNFWLANGDVELSSPGKLFHFDKTTKTIKQWLDINGKNPLATNNPFYIHTAKNNTVWIGTQNGLLHINTRTKQTKWYRQSDQSAAFSNDNIITIQEHEDGRLLLGSNGGSLQIFDPITGDIEYYNKENCGLKNNKVAGILPDEKGNYFISTYNGLAYLDMQKKTTGHFFQKDGLNANEFNRRSFFKDKEERYYFGGINGFSVFRAEDLLRPEQYPAPCLTEMRTYDRNAGLQKQITNLQNRKNISIPAQAIYYEFDWALPAYEDPENNQYFVQLKGYDTDWQFTENQSTIHYDQLPSGTYTLCIKGGDGRNNWDNPILEVPIIIDEFWYEKWWIQLLAFCTFLSTLLGVYQWTTNRERRKSKEYTRINKKIAELELQALQAQLNPHFIFNSLGAIQYFLQENRTDEADRYLGKFAKLMRMFLESSKNKYISLQEEVDLIKLYVEMEQLRFEGRFIATFEVDNHIDIYSTEIPSVLLQPFVENAINHGLFHKEDNDGHLLIKISEKSSTIEVIIEDNGIGRKAAHLIRKKSIGNHKSRAMQIVNERIEVLSQVDDYNIEINTVDLYHAEDESPAGTRVIILIPEID